MSSLLQQLPTPCTEQQCQLLERYLDLLTKWNKKINLTAITQRQAMREKHLWDSLALAPYVTGDRIVDVGCGAGIPGIPLAVKFPQKQFVLVDAVRKKVHFVQHAIVELGLRDVEALHTRIEQYQPPTLFDQIVCRAFAKIPKILSLCAHVCAPQARLLIMKGQDPHQECQQLPNGFHVQEIIAYQLPISQAARHIVIIQAP